MSLFKRLPTVMQSEHAECGIACLAMIAGYHGLDIDLATLRAQAGTSLAGARLDEMMRISGGLDLATRALRTEPEALDEVALPAVLHVDFNHFVVLERVRSGVGGLRFDVRDPASGRRTWRHAEMSERFTGIALELKPDAHFRRARLRRRVSLRTLVGRPPALAAGVTQAIGFALTLEVFVLSAPFFLQWVTDDVIVSADHDLLTVLVAGFALLAVFQALTGALRSYVLTLLGLHLNLAMTRRLFGHLLRLPMRFFAARSLGDLNARFGSLDAIAGTLTGGALGALMDGLMSIATFALMLYFSPLLTTVVVAAAAGYALLRWILFAPLRAATEDHIVRRAKRDSHFLESLRGMQGIRLFGRARSRDSAFQNLLVAEYKSSLRVERIAIVYRGLNALLFGVENLLVVALAAHLIIAGQFSLGMLLAFLAYKQQFVGRIGGVIDAIIEFVMLNLHRERVGDIALEPAEDAAHAGTLEPASYELEIDDVGFKYTDSQPPVLAGAKLTLSPGESVAVVGPSGCGKSTLAKVVLGLLQPTVGEVRIGGIACKRISAHWRSRNIAAVMQDDTLFAGTLYDNIGFFDENLDRERAEACARVAALDEEIRLLPMGYHTLVGDMGSALSGGQKQRLLIARALYRQPKILVLDEATSHLDIANERIVSEGLKRLGITTLTVAHRPETIAHADRVVTLAGANAGTTAGRAFLAA